MRVTGTLRRGLDRTACSFAGMSDFWFCVKHHRVEQGSDMCPPIDRLGPFDTREAAEGALANAERRNQEWDAQDDE